MQSASIRPLQLETELWRNGQILRYYWYKGSNSTYILF
jgi:hypothetical protein